MAKNKAKFAGPPPMVEVGLLVDDSGSMGGCTPSQPFYKAMQGADRIVAGLQHSLIPLNVTARTFCYELATDKPHHELPIPLVPEIRDVFAGCGTPLASTMNKMLDAMHPETKQRALIVMTDGQDDNGWSCRTFRKNIANLIAEGGTVLFVLLGIKAHTQYYVDDMKGFIPTKNILEVDPNADLAEAMYDASQVLLDFLSSGNKSAGFTKEQRERAQRPKARKARTTTKEAA